MKFDLNTFVPISQETEIVTVIECTSGIYNLVSKITLT